MDRRSWCLENNQIFELANVNTLIDREAFYLTHHIQVCQLISKTFERIANYSRFAYLKLNGPGCNPI